MANFGEIELIRLRELFDYLDADRDGYINHHDLRRLLHEEFGRDIAEERAAELIARADPEGYGRIGFDNFRFAVEAVLIKLKSAFLLIAEFKRFDVDGTGYIRREDLRRIILEVRGDIEEARIDELIFRCNPREDGFIRFEDFKLALIAHLRR